MCDACLLLGKPWLPELHGGQPRPRAGLKAMRLRQAGRPKPMPAAEPPRPAAKAKRRT
jgi:hypothetical protein